MAIEWLSQSSPKLFYLSLDIPKRASDIKVFLQRLNIIWISKKIILYERPQIWGIQHIFDLSRTRGDTSTVKLPLPLFIQNPKLYSKPINIPQHLKLAISSPQTQKPNFLAQLTYRWIRKHSNMPK